MICRWIQEKLTLQVQWREEAEGVGCKSQEVHDHARALCGLDSSRRSRRAWEVQTDRVQTTAMQAGIPVILWTPLTANTKANSVRILLLLYISTQASSQQRNGSFRRPEICSPGQENREERVWEYTYGPVALVADVPATMVAIEAIQRIRPICARCREYQRSIWSWNYVILLQ